VILRKNNNSTLQDIRFKFLNNEPLTNIKVESWKDSRKNKGLAFTIEERKSNGIHGLLPATVRTQESQKKLVLENLKRLATNLDRYVYLMHLLERNEKLFYKVLSSNVEDIMPIVYTPTVGEACIKYGLIFNQPKGIFISITDKGHVYDVLLNWPIDDVKVIVVTDGERILGLGDLGAQGMAIPVGKLALYTALAGVNPAQCLPITLDVGTDNEAFLSDANYIGLSQKRTRGQEYDDFLDEFVNAVKRRFGNTCLIQFEDFHNSNAFRLLEKYKNTSCTFNDDIQGTAAVVLSGLLVAVKETGKQLTENNFLFYGAGEAAIGSANLISLALMKHGLSEQEARDKVWLVDSKGLVVKDRPEGCVNHLKAPFAKNCSPLKNLTQIVDFIKPTALIGCVAHGNIFNEEVLKKMASLNKRPIIFALSNPTSKAECTAEEAYVHTNGNAIFASGSPFSMVELNGRKYFPGQSNNCYIFPGVGLACVACNIKHVTNEFFMVAAESLSEHVSREEMSEGRVFPNLNRIQAVSLKIAVDVSKYALSKNLCHLDSMPDSVEEFIKTHCYKTDYD
jgi:malate dehydrogenase (oxaloacetate-decarboxylating)(NADP+)